jgi:hypothetical protein
MPKKPELVSTPDPSLPFTGITINGKVYKMVFKHSSLAIAEDKLLARGYEVNLLVSYLRRTFSSVRVLFAASLLAYHPDLDFNEAQDLVDDENILEIVQAIDKAWHKSSAEADADAGAGPLAPAE